MDIVAIKVGENEPGSYDKFDKSCKDGDIVELLPRKHDEEGKLLNRTMGKQGDRQFLGLSVDMWSLDDAQYEKLRGRLTQGWGEVKRLYRIDTSRSTFLSADTKQKIRQMAEKWRAIKPEVYKRIKAELLTRNQAAAVKKRLEEKFDMMEINRFDKAIGYLAFAKMAVNKETGETLAEELGIG